MSRNQKRKIYFSQDKIKCADVVGDTRHVISLSNRSRKQINLPMSTACFFGNRGIMDPIFPEFCIKGLSTAI